MNISNFISKNIKKITKCPVILWVCISLSFCPTITAKAQSPQRFLAGLKPSQLSHSQIWTSPSQQFERQIFNYINEMRRDPKAFYKKYVKDYIKENSSRFTSRYTSSLKKDLYHISELPLFHPNSTLEKTASRQLDYLIKLGGNRLTHHRGRITFADRMKETGLHCFAENLYRSPRQNALEVILDLLIDQGVPSFGHRKNLLNPDYDHIGIESGKAANGYYIVVMDFGCASASSGRQTK